MENQRKNANIGSSVIELTINNDPDRLISFNPEDPIFAEHFYILADQFDKKLAEYQKRAEALDADKRVDKRGIPLNFLESTGLLKEACLYMRGEIDKVFGEGTSQKAFGDYLVMRSIAEFFEGVTPYIKKVREETTTPFVKHRTQESVERERSKAKLGRSK